MSLSLGIGILFLILGAAGIIYFLREMRTKGEVDDFLIPLLQYAGIGVSLAIVGIAVWFLSNTIRFPF